MLLESGAAEYSDSLDFNASLPFAREYLCRMQVASFLLVKKTSPSLRWLAEVANIQLPNDFRTWGIGLGTAD